jgi:hypothetical protein
MTRDLLLRQRTMTVKALHGHLAEFGLVAVRVCEVARRIRSAWVTFFKSWLGRRQSFSYTGVSVRSVRLPDGARVSREVHATF